MSVTEAAALPHSHPRRISPALWLCFAILGVFAVWIVAAPWVSPYDPAAVNLRAKLQPPSAEHWLGTDHLGRDMLSRLIWGARASLGAVAISLGAIIALGVAIGGLSGFVGGRTDQVLMRLAEVFLTIPTTVLALFMIGVLGTGMTNVIIAIVLSHWAWYARIVRGLTLSLRERDFILAARAAGMPAPRIFATHILPALMSQITVLATLDIGHMMLHVAGLSFLGLGIAPPAAEWGVMIGDARQFIFSNPLLIILPGLMIFLAVLAFNRLGDALRDRLDPTLQAEGHC